MPHVLTVQFVQPENITRWSGFVLPPRRRTSIPLLVTLRCPDVVGFLATVMLMGGDPLLSAARPLGLARLLIPLGLIEAKAISFAVSTESAARQISAFAQENLRDNQKWYCVSPLGW